MGKGRDPHCPVLGRRAALWPGQGCPCLWLGGQIPLVPRGTPAPGGSVSPRGQPAAGASPPGPSCAPGWGPCPCPCARARSLRDFTQRDFAPWALRRGPYLLAASLLFAFTGGGKRGREGGRGRGREAAGWESSAQCGESRGAAGAWHAAPGPACGRTPRSAGAGHGEPRGRPPGPAASPPAPRGAGSRWGEAGARWPPERGLSQECSGPVPRLRRWVFVCLLCPRGLVLP